MYRWIRSYPSERLAHMLDNAQISVLLTQEKVRSRVTVALGSGALSGQRLGAGIVTTE